MRVRVILFYCLLVYAISWSLQFAAIHATGNLESDAAKPWLAGVMFSPALIAMLFNWRVTTARGTFYREVRFPLGDPKNPMTWEHVQAKMRSQAEPVLGRAAVHAIEERVMSLESEADIRELVQRLVVWR